MAPLCPEPQRQHLAAAAGLALIVGLAYYLIFRILPTGPISDWTHGSLPSLIHMLVLTWMAFALTGSKRGMAIAIPLLAISIIGEWQIGYSSILDTIALIAGFCIAAVTGTIHLRHVLATHRKSNTTLVATGLLLTSIGFITGTSCDDGRCDSSRFNNARPVYMDYQTLRSSIRVSEPRPLKDVSRVYLYRGAVLLNSRNEGIHLLDNRDPANPKNIAFIEIPGNTEISIRNNYLYVDSYVDLVTLSINDLQNVTEVDRDENIFEYDAYQNVPDDVFFTNIDESRGVVVSYVRAN